MCPDDALLSAYADGEVPSPWKERMDSHILGCSTCSARVSEYRSLSQAMVQGFTAAERRALGLAKSRIDASVDFSIRNRKASLSHGKWWEELWSRRVALPMPFLAVSAAAFVLLFGAAMGLFSSLSTGRGNNAAGMAAASGSITVQAASLEMMAQYLRQQSTQPVMIEIPSEPVFYQPGNPLIVSDSENFMLEPTTTSYGSATR